MSGSSNQCIDEFNQIKAEHLSLYDFKLSHNFQSDFPSCANSSILTQICSVEKNFIESELLCFPRTCNNDNIRDILIKNQHWSFLRSDCRNVDNPTTFLALLTTFLITVTLFIILGTFTDVISSNKFMTYTNKFVRKFLNFLLNFSLLENLKSLFNIKSSSSSIDCLHGLKAFSMLFIVLRHTFQIVTNYQKVPKSQDFERLNVQSLYFTAILPTDTFFVVSGILVAKFFIQRKNLFSQFFQNFFQRYMRLTPSGAIVIIIDIAIKFILMENHPNYFYDPEIENCKKFWWTSLLHIQTYWNTSDMCFGSFWFASVLMQTFLVTPFILVIVRFLNLYFGIIFMALMLFFTQLPAYYASLRSNEIQWVVTGYYYTEAITRSYPYFVGLFYYWLNNKTGKLGKFQNIFGWMLSTPVLIAPLALIFNHIYTSRELNHHYLLIRLFWPFAICWIVHSCHNGFGGIINKILSFKFLIPLSNISLGIYLLNDHTALFLTESLLTSPSAYSALDIAYIYFLTYMVDIVAAMVLYLFIEVPFHRLTQTKKG